MAGRRVFFSFHYEEDIWRASNARSSGLFDARAAAGWSDASLWEETKRRGPAATRCLIDEGLKGTSVTVVLIGAHTAQRDWVTYEIEKSIKRGNGLLGVRIHAMRDPYGRRISRGAVPKALAEGGFRVYTLDPSNFGRWNFGKWVELAAIDADKECLRHQTERCWRCKFFLRYW
jgi:hypothetical protein